MVIPEINSLISEDAEFMKSQNPAIIGVGRTKFGEHYERDPESLIEEAGLQALDSAGVTRKDLNACYLSDYFLQVTNKIGLEEGFFSELLELHVPMEKTRSFSSALSNACHAVQSGKYDIVLVGGMEKMTDRWDKIRDDLMLLEDPWSYYAGCTPEANHELLLKGYIKKYNIKGENLEKLYTALAQISVKNHKNATANPQAQYKSPITVETVLKARNAACKSLGMFDFAPISDGAAALILTSADVAKKHSDNPVSVLGSASATDYITFPAREERTGFMASTLAMENALKQSQVRRSDIQIAELYDQSTLLEMLSLEDLGFCKKGTAWQDIHKSCEKNKGFYKIDDQKLFVNLNGGLKADGNPLGATGGAQVFEVVTQLRGEAKNRQVQIGGKTPKLGVVSELEGFGTKSYVHILGRNQE
jgi:acetyl-CoA C-acetyltransferase